MRSATTVRSRSSSTWSWRSTDPAATTPPRRSAREGDFVTSPHVHSVFGRLLGRALRELHAELGAPSRWRVVEVGAGDGTLARQVLGALADLLPRYVAVERSEGARRSLSTIEGIVAVDARARRPGRTVRHPRARAVGQPAVPPTPWHDRKELREVRVGLDDGELVEVLTTPQPSVGAAALEPGDEIVLPDARWSFVDRIAATLREGYALFIDYGGIGPSSGPDARLPRSRPRRGRAPRSRQHRRDGGCGLRAHRSPRRGGGAHGLPFHTQRGALTALGFGGWADDERAAAGGAPRRGAGRRGRPGVGRAAAVRRCWLTHRVSDASDGCCSATPGLAAPPWLARALATD